MNKAVSLDPRQLILNAPLSTYQRTAITLTVVLCALDGFDVLAVTYAAPGFLAEWGLSHTQLGVALSMGLVGMALGSFLLAPLADIVGRRKMVFISLGIMAVGMAASATAGSLTVLAVWRVITGLGIGAMMCIINPLAAEYANLRRRDLAIALMASGYPIGGAVGGLVSAQLLAMYDWRAVFVFGSVMALLMVPLVMRWLPEPVGYLIDNPRADTLAKVNRYLGRCGLPVVDSLPPPSERANALPLVEIFSGQYRQKTLYFTVLYSLYVMSMYCFLSWMPQLVAELGLTATSAALVAVSRDVMGIVGGLLVGLGAHYFGLKRLTLVFVVGISLMLMLFGYLPADITVLRMAAGLLGLCSYGGMIGLYAVMARTFDTHVRATGTGFVVGVGRVCSALGPLLGGYLLSLGLEISSFTMILGIITLTVALMLLLFKVRAVSVN